MTASSPEIAEMLTLLRQVHAAVTGGGAAIERAGPDYLYPDPVLTPGVVNPAVTEETIHATIAVAGWTATIRPPEAEMLAMKRASMAAYGFTDDPANYEYDHFISLELGGHPSDPRNLWPQRYADQTHDVGARQKDRVETALKGMVVRGEITLAEAQRQIVTDWYAVFLRLHKAGRLPMMVRHDPPA